MREGSGRRLRLLADKGGLAMDSENHEPDPGEQKPEAETPPPRTDGELHGAPRGVIWIPFVLGAGLTFLLPLALGDSVTGTWVLVSFLVGGVAAASHMAWVWTHRPRPPSAAAHSIRSAKDQGRSGGEADPLGHIHAVESQGRRHQKPCTNCGTPVDTGRERCPNCDHLLIVACKGCRTPVRLDWNICPECGRDLP